MDTQTKNFVAQEFSELSSIYFNAAYFGPSPSSAKKNALLGLQKEVDPSFYLYSDWMGIPDRVRAKLATLLGVSSNNIAHQTSSSDIVNIVANGFPFEKGDRVAAINKDYPSNVLPWMLAKSQGRVEFDLIDLGDELIPTAEWLAKKLHPSTKVFNISYVTFDTGKKVDILSIGKMLKERDIFFMVDVTQAFGGMPITAEELKYIDVVACSCYKWMLGPYGAAFAYFSDDALKKVQHRDANWINSPKSKVVYNLLDYTVETLAGARKFDRGQAANLMPMHLLEGSVDFLNGIGLDRIEKHNREVRDYFLSIYPKSKYKLVTPTDAMANIVCLKSNGEDSIQLENELHHRNIDVSVRQGNVRLSFHVFNTKEQVDKLVEALDH